MTNMTLRRNVAAGRINGKEAGPSHPYNKYNGQEIGDD
jgi:hypothetical protein